MRLIPGVALFNCVMVMAFSPTTQSQVIDLSAIELKNQAELSVQSSQSTGLSAHSDALVVLVRFADHREHVLPTMVQMNQSFEGIGWVDLPYPQSYYAGEKALMWQAVTEALAQTDLAIDFSWFDGGDGSQKVTIVHSGAAFNDKDSTDGYGWELEYGLAAGNYNLISLADALTLCSKSCVEQSQLIEARHVSANIQVERRNGELYKSVLLYWHDTKTGENQVIIERCELVSKGEMRYCDYQPIANIDAMKSSFADEPGVGHFKYRLKVLAGNSGVVYSNEVEI